jgi:hypothetical protein
MYDDAYGRRSRPLAAGPRRPSDHARSSGELEASVRENVRVRPFVNGRRCAALRDRTGDLAPFSNDTRLKSINRRFLCAFSDRQARKTCAGVSIVASQQHVLRSPLLSMESLARVLAAFIRRSSISLRWKGRRRGSLATHSRWRR